MERYIITFLGEPHAPFAENTRLVYDSAINQYLQWARINGLDCLSSDSSKAWFDCLSAKGLKLSTIHLKRSALKSFFQFCMDEGYISDNPILGIKLKPVTIIKKPILTDIEILHLCETCIDNVRDRAIIQLFLDSGLRISEICNLNITDVNNHKPSLKIAPGKNRIEREMPLTYMAAGLINKYLDTRTDRNPALFITRLGNRFTRQGMHKLFKGYSNQINNEYTPHSCRWHFGTELARRGFKAEEILELMGHQVLKSTDRYINPTEQQDEEFYKRHYQD